MSVPGWWGRFGLWLTMESGRAGLERVPGWGIRGDVALGLNIGLNQAAELKAPPALTGAPEEQSWGRAERSPCSIREDGAAKTRPLAPSWVLGSGSCPSPGWE